MPVQICQHCGLAQECSHVDEHPGSCCDCFEMFDLKLGLAPWKAGGLPVSVEEKVRRALERRPDLADVLRAAEESAQLRLERQ